jgi:ketosteroid isomerase-like protein
MASYHIDTSRVPARGFGYQGGEVRRQGRWERKEVEEALQHYHAMADRAVELGDWNVWADIFTDDAIYVEHQYGVMRGSKEIRSWICGVMSAGTNPEMSFPVEQSITMIDNDFVGLYVPNRYNDPNDPNGEPYQFVSYTILLYAGDGQWCYEEDIYNAEETKRIHGLYASAKQQASS